MPRSPQNGQTAFLGLGLVPSTKAALEDYTKFVNSADPKDPAVQAQSIQLSRHILEGDLAAMPALKKNEKILSEDVEGELHIRPLPAPTLKKSAGVADLRRIVSKDDLRPAMTGVFLDVKNKRMVATNGHVMAIIPDWTLTGNNRIISLSTQKEIDARYPDYQNVVPIDRQLVATVSDLPALRARLNGLVQANKLIDVSDLRTIRAEISYGSYYYYYDPQFLLDLVTVLQVTGSTALKLEFDSVPNRSLVLRDALDPQKVAIIMPIMNNLGIPGTERTTTWPFCTVLQFTGDEKPASTPKAASTEQRPLLASKGKEKAAAPASSYQPPRELLAALGFELLSKEATMTWYSYNEPVERRSVRLTLFAGAGIRIEDDREGGRRSKIYEGSLRDKQEFEQKLALVNWKKFDFKAKAPAKLKEAKPTPAPLDYFNAKGKPVTDLTGKIDPEKLYYLQPDGSYEQGGDRRSPGHVKPPKAKKVKAPKAPKAPKAAKIKPVDTREEVPQLSGEVLLMQAFLKMEGKPATIDQVRALHRRMEKDFTKQKVRKTSKHADVLRGIAGTVAALYAKMTDKQIGSIAKLEFKSVDTKQLAEKAKAIVGGVRVGTATTLLSAFVNMQGTVPTEKAVTNLRTKLENEFEEHPDGDFALAVGAAAAVLKDWRAGKPVRITKQQLSGLAGLMDLGCPDTPPGKSCGCSAAPKKARR